jgi:hypothetical protein
MYRIGHLINRPFMGTSFTCKRTESDLQMRSRP